jgi:hypothetical protein
LRLEHNGSFDAEAKQCPTMKRWAGNILSDTPAKVDYRTKVYVEFYNIIPIVYVKITLKLRSSTAG